MEIDITSNRKALLGTSYALVDSGEGMKLERFGEHLIARPSSLAIWKKGKEQKTWKEAAASYDPDKGWQFHSKKFDDWLVEFPKFSFKLRLQTNGQVGIFPEHASYIGNLISENNTLLGAPPRVLSLFAYTGLATVLLGKNSAEVCHVDLSRKILDWASENVSLNNVSPSKLRFIPEDAVEFLRREVRRKNSYDIVIMDPPSFSRTDKKKSWKLEEIVFDLIQAAIALLESSGGLLVFTCHHHALQAIMLENIFSDFMPEMLNIIKCQDLFIEEENGRHKLPCGACLIARIQKSK